MSSRRSASAPAIAARTPSDGLANGRTPGLDVAGRAALGNAQPRLPDPERPRPGDRRFPLRGQLVARGQGRCAAPRRHAAADARFGAAPDLLTRVLPAL